MSKPRQIVMHCPCGKSKVLARGLCQTCYTLKRQDQAYFGGHRENVLKRDAYRRSVPGCSTIKRGKRSVAVHHREPGDSDPAKMLTLCLPCHAKVSRTLFVQDNWPSSCARCGASSTRMAMNRRPSTSDRCPPQRRT